MLLQFPKNKRQRDVYWMKKQMAEDKKETRLRGKNALVTEFREMGKTMFRTTTLKAV